KIKHGMDIVLCVIGLALLAVPMGLIALAQKIMYPTEPVFFLQNRVGLGGKIFRIIKFRTMRADAPRDMATRQFENYGENTTPFGDFLRRFSIDELPQLFNVLAGDMALIGPRPLIASEQPIQTLRERSGVYCVRPGITGLAQINGRDRLNDYEKAYYDREYVQNLSCKQDLLIFFRSFSYILMQKDLGKNDNNSDPLFADCDQSAT
ncbi:MAG: sugar transferase, partial [Firmicutes bacterium]|nr:sugar transferase [Bacillota bacterium]